MLLGLDSFVFLWLVCCNKRKEENTKTIEKANRDFNQLIEQNGFINTGAKMPTGFEVYYGNIPLSERDFKRNSEYVHILQLAARNEEKLTETLTEAQKEAFGKFKDNTSELTSMTEVTAFTIGFKLGLRLIVEAYTDGGEHNLTE